MTFPLRTGICTSASLKTLSSQGGQPLSTLITFSFYHISNLIHYYHSNYNLSLVALEPFTGRNLVLNEKTFVWLCTLLSLVNILTRHSGICVKGCTHLLKEKEFKFILHFAKKYFLKNICLCQK